MALDKKFKKRWLKALRGGRYLQAQKVLVAHNLKTDTDSFCCLGVACNLLVANGEATWEEVGYRLGLRPGLPDFKVLNKIGLPYETADKLAQMNDGNEDTGVEPQSFLQIADWIEDNL